jgi:hypothetical protein
MSKEAQDTYEDLLVQLHVGMSSGRDEDENDVIRDQMEDPWYRLSEEERHLAGHLSGDLYFLDKKVERYLIGNPFNEATRSEIKTAFDGRQWALALELFRRLPELTLEDLYHIGKCYENLGFHLAAKCFFDFVADPANAGYVSVGKIPE